MAHPDYEAMEGFEAPRALNEGDELFRIPTNPWCDGCDGTEWEAVDKGGRRCKACGETYRTEDRYERELRPEEGYVRVQRVVEIREGTGDERPIISICTGRDDQRPDHDPAANIYRPIRVAQHLRGEGSSVYTYLKYCGKCRHKWGNGMASDHGWTFCPHCACTIGTYVSSDGTEHWHHPQSAGWDDPNGRPPEVWPDDG